VVGLQGVREGRVCDGEEEHAAAEHLGGDEICAVGGGRERAAGVSQSRTSTSCLASAVYRCGVGSLGGSHSDVMASSI